MQHNGAQFPGHVPLHSKSGSLQQTDHYVWNTADALGKGATAVVYFGRERDNGDVCAVKVFNEREWRHDYTSRQREIETLRSLQHDNIVKLLALETEHVTSNVVLIMEFCSGGSVFTMLEQPQHAFGFQEIEFMLFFVHIAHGMQYLRSRGYIHRDIKPGNIMRFIAENGRSVYKLTDFGAARELQDDETFMSIYGTEEYLFPDMYKRAVLRQPGGNPQFDASVDIWSLGVTIYHVATGLLPFKPYGGRSNAHTMHTITSTKPSGVISGVQHGLGSPIDWRTDLPQTCQLSSYVQNELIKLLGGLMETDQTKMWAFEKYFDVVSTVHAMVSITVYSCCTGQHLVVYLNTKDTISTFLGKLQAESGIPSCDQLLLWIDKDLSDIVDINTHVHSFPKHILKSTLCLINRRSMENCALKTVDMPSFPDVDGFENLESDAQMSRKATSVAFYVCTMITTYQKQQESARNAEIYYRMYIKRVIWQSETIVSELGNVLEETKKRQDGFLSSFAIIMKLFNTLTGVLNSGKVRMSNDETLRCVGASIGQLDEVLKDESLVRFYEKIQVRLNEIIVYLQVLSRKLQEQELERRLNICGCTEDDHCIQKSEHMRQKIASASVIMTKHRKYKDLHPHEQFIHKCEKDKLQEYCVSLHSLAKDHCGKNWQNCFRKCAKEMGILTKHLFRTKKVEQNITSVKECQVQLSTKLGEEEDKCKKLTEKIAQFLGSSLNSGKVKLISLATQYGSCPTKLNTTVPHTSDIHLPSRKIPEGSETGTKYAEAVRSEWSSSPPFKPSTSAEDECSYPKKQRTMLLDKLKHELLSLESDSKELKHLVAENSSVMQQFLCETSNLHIEGSLDSDQRHNKAEGP